MKNYCKTAFVILLSLEFVHNSNADLYIELNSESEAFKAYGDATPFRIQYANVPSTFRGLLHQPEPSDACDYIQPLPDSALSLNHSWIAVIQNYSSCPQAMIENVRNAGYELILAYSSDNARLNVDNDITNSGFGVAVVKNGYADALLEHVVRDLNDTTVGNSTVIATITAVAVVTPGLVTTLFLLILFCCIVVACCCYFRRRSCCRNTAYDEFDFDGRQRNFERLQRQDRIARQELIESILRQLQELHVDVRSQIPLGEDETKKLPTRKYREGEEKIERCAICVEDFKDGDGLRVLPCEHAFHRQCIDEWLINHSAVCPLCKFEVPRNNFANRPPARQRDERTPLLSDDDTSSLPGEDLGLPVPRVQERTGNFVRYDRPLYGRSV